MSLFLLTFNPFDLQVHRTRRIQGEPVRHKHRGHPLRPGQEQNVHSGRAAGGEEHIIGLNHHILSSDTRLMCVNLPLSQALKRLRTAEFKPYVIFVKPRVPESRRRRSAATSPAGGEHSRITVSFLFHCFYFNRYPQILTYKRDS